MTQPSSKVQDALVEALRKMTDSIEMSESESEWLRQFVMRLVAEFSLVKQQEVESEEQSAA